MTGNPPKQRHYSGRTRLKEFKRVASGNFDQKKYSQKKNNIYNMQTSSLMGNIGYVTGPHKKSGVSVQLSKLDDQSVQAACCDVLEGGRHDSARTAVCAHCNLVIPAG